MKRVWSSCKHLVFILSVLAMAPSLAQTPTPYPVPATTPVPFDNNAKIGTSADPTKRMHWGADESRLNRKTSIVTLRGDAYLMRDNEELHADEMEFNQKTQFVRARGRVRYQYGQFFVKADAIDLDLKNKTGTIYNGNLTNGQFALRGSKMEQIGENRFLVKDYDYTTCLDCPNSWEITGGEVDLTIEGYAFIKDFVFKIKDASLLWFPYMVMPVKTKRQSGLLFPRIGGQQSYGIYFIQPYYWAINDWSDMTFGAGYYSKRGTRFEWEGRYAISDRSGGLLNFFYVNDSTAPDAPAKHARYAAKAAITQELPWGIEGKLRFNEVSDTGYPIEYAEDMPFGLEPTLSSDLFFYRNRPTVSTVVAARRIRNLLVYDRNNNYAYSRMNDPQTVQEIPRVVVNSNDQFLFGSAIGAGIEARFNRFTRGAGPFDYLNGAIPCDPLFDPGCRAVVRQADRFTFIPNLYTSFHPWSWLTVTPNAQYRAYLYNFEGAYDGINPAYNTLATGYLLTQTEFSAQLEKMIQTGDPQISYKHIIRPTLVYSWIPTIQQNVEHPFNSQAATTAQPGQYFDNSDLIPINASQNLETYFPPLGNSITYGVVTQLFRRYKPDRGDLQVSKRLEASLTQTLDLQAAARSLDINRNQGAILSPLFTHVQYDSEKYSAWMDYTYYAYLESYPNPNPGFVRSPHRFALGMTWNFEKEIHDGIMQFERSFSMVYSFSKLTYKLSNLQTFLNFSINDYIMPRVAMNFDLTTTAPVTLPFATYTVLFQSPSRCWRLEAGVSQSSALGEGFSPIFNFAFNLTGQSFGSFDQSLK